MKHEQDSRFLNAFDRLFSPDELDTLGQKTGFMKRRRQVTPHKFCMALVSALGSGTTNSITDIHRQFNHMHFTNIQLKPLTNACSINASVYVAFIVTSKDQLRRQLV